MSTRQSSRIRKPSAALQESEGGGTAPHATRSQVLSNPGEMVEPRQGNSRGNKQSSRKAISKLRQPTESQQAVPNINDLLTPPAPPSGQVPPPLPPPYAPRRHVQEMNEEEFEEMVEEQEAEYR